jgi:hypothetical protein
MSHSANVTICSPLRDFGNNFPAYLARVQALEWPAAQLRFIAVEGDSADNTYYQLAAWRDADPRVTLLKCDCHQPRFGSIVDPARFRVLATVFNKALDAVDLDWTDYVLFLPCDIRYTPDLLSTLVACQKDVVAPFSWQEEHFYDVWGFTVDGRSIGWCSELEAFLRFGHEPVAFDTVGGTVLLSNAVVSAGCRYTVDAVDRGLCAMAKAAGFGVYGHPGVKVYHPPYGGWHG